MARQHEVAQSWRLPALVDRVIWQSFAAMMRVLGTIVAAGLVGGGCVDEPSAQLSASEVLERLRAIPGLTADEMTTEQPGVHYFVLHFTQPVDHSDPSQGTFQQEVSLLHRSERAPVPMIVHTSGYADYYLDQPVELTKLLEANQVSIEHRFYGHSRPNPADWTKLTIAQMAADEHDIITALRTIYGGAFLSTGGSKGGMTAVFHRKFYPADVDGTVAYVAPLSFGAPDPRYADYVETIGDAPCRQAVRDLATEMLAHRRDTLEFRARAQPNHVYTRVAIGAALESAIDRLEWSFWQTQGIDQCITVPAPGASDDDLFGFLDKISPVSEDADDMLGFYEPYYYQTYNELGYPDYGAAYLAPYRRYAELDYSHELPTPAEPSYDTTSMLAVDDFVEHQGNRLLFIYGEWDPWTGGKFVLGDATDSAVLIQPRGTHYAKIATLESSDRDDALARLAAWTGVTPNLARARRGARGDGAGVGETPEPK
jgi:hypothetical protein